MLAYMWLLGKSNSTLLEERKYLLLPLDNPSFKDPKKRIKMKKPKSIEELEKPIKKKKNRKRWHKKKDPSSNSSSPDPDPYMASEVEQEETPPPKDE